MPPERRGADLSTLLSMGIVNALCLVVGLGLGWLIDSAVGTFPVFALVGLLLGLVAGCFYTVAEFRKFLKP